MRPKGLKAWFTFFRKEHTGAAVLLGIALLGAIAPRLFFNHSSPDKYSFPKDSMLWKNWAAQQQERNDSLKGNSGKRSFRLPYSSKAKLMAMGFSPEAALRLENALKQGKKFSSYAEISAVTGMDSHSLSRLVKP